MDDPLDELRQIISDRNVARLSELSFRDKNLQEIPPEIGKLVNFKKLDLSGNKIQEIPPEIGN